MMSTFSLFLKTLVVGAILFFVISLLLIYWPQPAPSNQSHLDFNVLNSEKSVQENELEQTYLTRDGQELFYRYYDSQSPVIVVLIHGSSSDSRYLSPLASYLSQNQLAKVVLPDLRGHGRSAFKQGDISYLGQYDDDLADFITDLKKRFSEHKIILGGHSSGGGLTVRYAGLSKEEFPAVDGYILLAPYLHYESPTQRPNSGEWVTVHTKRMIGLSLLNGLSIRVFNHLPVLWFNLDEKNKDPLQQTYYSYRLNESLAPKDYLNDLTLIEHHSLLLVGEQDEAFYSDRFKPLITPINPLIEVDVLADVKHLDVVSHPKSLERIQQWLLDFDQPRQ